ncbi:MAG: NfeD family protein [Opitutaceae bacterium]
MTAVLTFFIAALLLIAAEIVVPGGVLGVIGGLCLLAGVISAYGEWGAAGGSIATGIALLIGCVTIYLEFVWLPKSRLARKFFMAETVAGRSQPEVAERTAVLGREAVAVTTLSPSGYVELDGRRYEAFSQSGHTVAGARVKVQEVDNFRLLVTQIKESS